MAIQLIKFSVLVFGVVASFISVVSATAGTATVNTIYVPSACFGYEDQGVMTAAASDALWDNGAACGRMYSVSCTGPTNQGVPQPCTGSQVTVKIVDFCPPPGCQGTLDIAQEAFSQIADPAAGKITIEYNQ
ncbi:EG45-like domain containing protein [Juglans microcarpa x Juglans regia]|uniref:EG45-like domain containing protein n=1 Tax=Juglans microcarpa x Juglans regia TaxID=2249226 RepID=UPI001B7F2206|nr:EG45-like domain containing protein [Juglans microcarpa x Juglans regia]